MPAIAGCSQPMPVQPKEYQALELEWQEDDRLIFYNENGLFSLFTHSTPKPLLEEIPTEKMLGQLTYSWYYGSSPDNSNYILLTNGRRNIEIYSHDMNESKLLLQYSDRIANAGWFDNENIFYTIKYGLFLVNIFSGEQVLVTEDSAEVYAKALPNIEEPYISWVDNVKKIGEKLYYNGIREYPDLATSNIYCGNQFGEKKLLNNATLLIPVDDRRFVYFGSYPQKPDVTYYLYDIETGKSSLITKYQLLSTGDIFTTNNGKLVFMTGDTTDGSYQGTVFDPVTLQAQTFLMYERDMLDTNIAHHRFGEFMGALELDRAYIFLFSIQNKTYSQHNWNIIYLSYNTKTNKLTEISYDKNNTRAIDMHISPSGNYIAVCKYLRWNNNFQFNVLKSNNLLSYN